MSTTKKTTTGASKAVKTEAKAGKDKKTTVSKAKAPAGAAAPATEKKAAKPAPAKAAAKPAAKAKSAPAKAAAKPAATAKPAPAKAAAKPAATAKPAPTKATAKPAATTKPAPAKAAASPAATAKPAPAKAEAKETKNAASPKVEKKENKDALTPEEKARKAKLKATLALLKADPDWPAFLEAQREALLALRDKLLPNMQNVTRDHLRSGDSNVSSSSGQHIGDAGSEAEVRALTISLLGKDREQLFEIDAALERIRRGYYGICEVSLDPIPKKRLQARPFCRLTVKCQEEFEKKYGSYANYKAQKSDNVGYAGLQNDMENVFSLDEAED